MKYITCGSYGMTYMPAYVLGEYLRKHTKKRFYLYVSLGNRRFRKEPFHNYMKRTDYRASTTNGSSMHDFISLENLGEEFVCQNHCIDLCEHYTYIGKVLDNWWTSEVIAEIIENMPPNFIHHLHVHDIPKGTKYRVVEYDGAESIELETDIEWETAT